MSLKHGPKPKSLTSNETLNSLEIWKNNITYGLKMNPDFRPYLVEGFSWGKKSRIRPYRNLTDVVVHHEATEDAVTHVKTEAYDEIVKSREDRALDVDLLLDQIANYAEGIPRHDIVKDSASLDEVWQKIKLFYNLQSSGSLLNECWNVRRLPDETPQAVFARLKQTYDENLLTSRGLVHTEGQLGEDEEMSPTLLCTVILHWLEILHPKLRNLVTQRFATELRNHTYAAIFPEISRSIDSLLQEVDDDVNQSSCRAVSQRRSYFSKDKPFRQSTSYQKKNCDYCKVLGRRAFYTHNIEDCLFVKRESSSVQKKARGLTCDNSSEDDDIAEHYEEYYKDCDTHNVKRITDHVINRIVGESSPVLPVHHYDKSVNVTLDSGATCNVIGETEAIRRKCKVRPTNETARLADGESLLDVVGVTDLIFHRGKKPFHMRALVAANTDIDILGGMPFMCHNDIAIRPATSEIIIDGEEFVRYNPQRKTGSSKIRRISHCSIQSTQKEVILPGENLSINVPPAFRKCESLAVEPRLDSSYNRFINKDSSTWPRPHIAYVISDNIALVNNSKEPIIIKKHEQVCLLHDSTDNQSISHDILHTSPNTTSNSHHTANAKLENYSKPVKLNPDKILTVGECKAFSQLLEEYDDVFNPKVSQYNGKSGPCLVEVNMGKTLPPQRKGRTPFYGSSNMQELQDKMDELTEKGVFVKPQEIGVTVENVSPSFLVRKPSNPQQKRLVTDFGSIAPYCRPTPSLMPKIESVLQKVASWKYIITTDLTEAYYQLPLKKSSMRYCGVVTPFKGLLVYRVGCMGLPGVEVALEELTCLLLGDLVQRGSVAKVADDIYIGGNTLKELFDNLKIILHRLMENNLKLCARKTVIAPKEVNILGWLWSAGNIRASPHRLAALAECSPPVTVSAMRSFIGAYRFVSRVLKGYAATLAPLEKAVAGGKSGKEEVTWTDELTAAFKAAQGALADNKTLTVPRPEDTLWVVTDASVQPGAVGATLYTVRDGEPRLAEFFNVKLPEFQQRWLPCELEGIAIGTALHHFSPYIIQSDKKPHVLTDSKPCVEAVQKLKKGQFSSSARLSTFLSSVSRYQASVSHISGAANLPSDFSSRHPTKCDSASCQICGFIKEYSESVVHSLSVTDILHGKVQVPYKNRKAWIEVQQGCPDLRKVFAFKKSGTEPAKKAKNLRCVRRYLSASLIVANDGLLVLRKADPLSPMTDHIVVPQQVLHGLLSSLHLKLDHPTAFQLTKVFSREFFALNANDAIQLVTKQCHLCESIKDVPRALTEQSCSSPPTCVGVSLAADVFKRSKQNILVLRETTTSYSLAELIANETSEEIANALLRMCCILRPTSIKGLIIRVDPAPAHRSLFLNLNSILATKNIQLELGRELNKNKNPVSEKAVRELSRELLILTPESQEISATTLALAVANLNSRVRAPGLSAYELWTQRDQISGEQLPIDDSILIEEQHERRLNNHTSSEKSKAYGKSPHPLPDISAGSLVYLYEDRDKESPRPRYLVISVKNKSCMLRRFTRKYFGGRTYQAKLDDCYAVPLEPDGNLNCDLLSDTDSDESYECENSIEMDDKQANDDIQAVENNAPEVLINPQSDDDIQAVENYPPEVLINAQHDIEAADIHAQAVPDPQSAVDNIPVRDNLNSPPRERVNLPEHKARTKTRKNIPASISPGPATRLRAQAARSKSGRECKLPAKFRDFVMEGDDSA